MRSAGRSLSCRSYVFLCAISSPKQLKLPAAVLWASVANFRTKIRVYWWRERFTKNTIGWKGSFHRSIRTSSRGQKQLQVFYLFMMTRSDRTGGIRQLQYEWNCEDKHWNCLKRCKLTLNNIETGKQLLAADDRLSQTTSPSIPKKLLAATFRSSAPDVSVCSCHSSQVFPRLWNKNFLLRSGDNGPVRGETTITNNFVAATRCVTVARATALT